MGPDRLAYQVLGLGLPDLVFTMGAFSHVDLVWDDPQMALCLRRLASFSRLLRQLWIVVPFAVVVAAMAPAWSGRRPSMGDR